MEQLPTKEQILRKHYFNYYRQSFPSDERTNEVVDIALSVKEEKACILAAMEEYAAVRAMPLVDLIKEMKDYILWCEQNPERNDAEGRGFKLSRKVNSLLSPYTGEQPEDDVPEEFVERHLKRIKELQKELKQKFAAEGDTSLQVPVSFLQELRQKSVSRAIECFKTYKNVPITYWTTALAGEIGELCNMVKKMERVNNGGIDAGSSYTAADIDNTMMKEEIGGIFIYLDLLASLYGIDLQDAVTETFNSKSEKYEFPYLLSAGEQPAQQPTKSEREVLVKFAEWQLREQALEAQVNHSDEDFKGMAQWEVRKYYGLLNDKAGEQPLKSEG